MKRLLLMSAMVCVLYMGSAPVRALAGSLRVAETPVVHELAEMGEEVYRLPMEGCDPRMEFVREGINAGILMYRYDCPMDMTLVGGFMGLVLDRLSAEAGLGEFHTVMLGRLVELSPEASARLALAAARSARWDTLAGRPGVDAARMVARGQAHGLVADVGTNELVRDLLMESGALDEAVEAFGRVKTNARASGVEKVLVARVSEHPMAEWLLEEGIAPDAIVPYDCMVWMILSPE
jgi:hypothetical protein